MYNNFFGYCLFLLHQRLEESVLSEEKKLTVQEGTSLDAPPKCLPARVREIVTKNLSESCESLPPFLPLTSHSSVFLTLILSLLSPPSLIPQRPEEPCPR